MTLTQPLKWHGGKSYLAERIIALMPPRCQNPNAPAADDPGWLHYVEPYAGGLAVLLANDPEGISEVANDINRNLWDFWAVLRDPEEFERFKKLCEATPFSEDEYHNAMVMTDDDWPVEHRAWNACKFFILCRQSLAGRMKSFAPLSRTRTRRGMNEQASAWLNAVEGLPAVHARLRRVAILNRPALEVIGSQDGPRTLFYLDPPYLHATRTSPEVYQHEMTEGQHAALLAVVSRCQGRVMLSGYPSALYDEALTDWTRHEIQVPNQAAGGKTKREMTEVIWCNF